ncbi:hypothetical protein [Streptomyces sp. NPDC020742]|uniref:hypothetical protein n=1 Tax=Streptomyces sp. NPDC020742 TaxID=3154897 RepID=UPI0033C2E2FF
MTPCEQAPAATAFDDLHTRRAAELTRQAYLLTGRPCLARRAVERAFQLAWQRWPEVAVDPDPAGWVRAAAYEYALTPWHRLAPRLRTARTPQRLPLSAGPQDRALLEAVLSLPAPRRRALLLHDGAGLGLAATAAECEASRPAAAGRLDRARGWVAARVPGPGLAGRPPEEQGAVLRARLAAVMAALEVTVPTAPEVRAGSERSARRTTRAVFALTGLFALTTLTVAVAAPDHGDLPRTRLGTAAPVLPEAARLRPDLR